MAVRDRLIAATARLISIADDPGDDDDVRLRKRAGVGAGLITALAPWLLPFESPAAGLGLAMAGALSIFSAVNLAVLARTRRFERYVVALIATGPVFVFSTNVLAGGVTGGSAGFVWAFLTPAYALIALGPRRATPWFLVFVATVVLAVVLDPIVRTWIAPPPYFIQVIFYGQNVIVPLTITFLLLRYTDLRRRAAEARSDELLTNAIPRSIAQRLRHGESRSRRPIRRPRLSSRTS